MNQTKSSIQFIILTCTVSWTVAGIAIFFGVRDVKGLIYPVFAGVYMFLPAVSAIILQLIYKEKLFRNLFISFKLNWWFLIAGFIPIICTFLALGINLLFPNVYFSTSHEGLLLYMTEEEVNNTIQQLSKYPPVVFLLMQIVNALIFGYTINAIFAFGEELGWRGYLVKTLCKMKFLTASFIIGIVWALWHFPLILIGHNYPQHPVAGVGMMVIFCLLLTPVMIYIVIKSKSVITAAVFHGTLNSIGGVSILFLTGGNDLTNGMTGLAGFLSLLCINLALYIYDKYITKENILTKSI